MQDASLVLVGRHTPTRRPRDTCIHIGAEEKIDIRMHSSERFVDEVAGSLCIEVDVTQRLLTSHTYALI